MSELTFEKVINTPIAKEIKAEQKKEVHHGSLKMHRGHTLFEINLVEKSITEAVYEDLIYDTVSEFNKVRKKVIMRDDCVCIPALNAKNALKKLLKKVGK